MSEERYPAIRFQAMNTWITAIGRTETNLAYWQRTIHRQFSSVERIASRFMPGSELSRLNDHPPGEPFQASHTLFRLLQDAWDMAVHTGFKFQPLIGTALWECGYDRSFELIEMKPKESPVHHTTDESSPIPDAPNHPDALEFDENTRTIRKHSRLQLDLGGIGKGWTADRAASLMRDTFGIQAGMIDAGGDMRIWSNGDPWCVGIQDPFQESEEMLQLWIRDAGVATSNVLHRSWERNGQRYHHIMDGHTYTTASSDIVQATVVAPTTAEADAAAKVICMLPSGQVYGWMAEHFPTMSYVLVKNNGEVAMNSQLQFYAEKVV